MTGTKAGMKRVADKHAASNEGYDQSNRWSYLVDGKIVPGKECDCSSTCGGIAKLAGYPVDLSGTFYTGNFASKMKAAGFRVLHFTGLSAVRDGDFLLTPGKHVEFVWGGRMYSARYDERGGKTGGKAGDQTGKETGWVTLKNRPGGWTYIVRPPAEAAVVKERLFRFGQANLQAERWQGLDDSSARRGQFLDKEMNCSVYALCEVSEEARYAIRDQLPGGRARWKVQEVGYVCVLWDSESWAETGTTERVDFETPYHGAVRVSLKDRKGSGKTLDVIAIHVRPTDSFGSADDDTILKGKKGDIAKGLRLARKGVPTLYAGDFNTQHAEDVILPAGFTRGTPNEDTVDLVGDQRLDATFMRGLTKRKHSKHDPGSISDHKTWVFNGTLG